MADHLTVQNIYSRNASSFDMPVFSRNVLWHGAVHLLNQHCFYKLDK